MARWSSADNGSAQTRPRRRERRNLPVILCALLAVPLQGLEGQQARGRIEGVATISSQLTKSRVRVRVYDEPGATTARPESRDHPFANVVLYLESTPALRSRSAPAGEAVAAMLQRGERFVPHVLAVRLGSRVDFPNEDPIYHNVFSLSTAREFDLGRYPRGKSKQVRFPKAGVVQLFCHLHSDMSGYIVVLDHSFFVRPDAEGRFVLDGIPPGEYQLVAWHERIRPALTPVRVEAGRTTQLELRIPLPDVPERR